MRSTGLFLLAFGIAAASLAAPAQGCDPGQRPIGLRQFRQADLVIVGRITRHEIIPDYYDFPKAQRAERIRPLIEDGYLIGHARVDILVDEALLGRAPRQLRATWGGSAHYRHLDEPPHGRLLIGLVHLPPFLRNGPPVPPTIIQPGCSEGFLFDNAGAQADAARRMLGLRPRGTITDALTSPAILLGNAAILLLGLVAWGVAASLSASRRDQALRAQNSVLGPNARTERNGGFLAAVSRQIGPSSLD